MFWIWNKKDNNNEIFNFSNYKVGSHNLIYNNKNIFWIQRIQWYNLQKKANKEAILPNFRNMVQETYIESKNCSLPYSIHNIKIKRQLNLSEYYTFFEFIGEILQKINPNLFDKYSKTYIPYFKDLLYNLTKTNDVFSYYYGISYGKPNEEVELFKDNYFFDRLKVDKERMWILLDKTKRWLKFNDGDTFWSDQEAELNVSMLLQEFFPNSFRLGLNYLNSEEGKSITKNVLQDVDTVLYFEKYIQEHYEDFKDRRLEKIKYRNKLFYNLIKIYEEAQKKFLKKQSFYEDMASLQIKEWLGFLKIEPYFVKMYFIHPKQQHLDIPDIEEKFIDATKESGFLIQYSSSSPIHSSTEADNELNKILSKWPTGEWAKEFRDTISQYLPFGIWDSCHYYIVFAERQELFTKLEQQLETMKKAYNVDYSIDNNLNYFLPWRRNDRHKFKMFWYELPWKDHEFIQNPKNSFFSYYPKNIIYQKGIFLGVNTDTSYPIFYHPFDTQVITNKNMFIVGSSGSWKTFMTKLMIERGLQYMKYIVIDHLDNYNDHCEVLWWKVVYLYQEKINFLYYDMEQNGEEGLREHLDAMEYLFGVIAKFRDREMDFLKLFLNTTYARKDLNGKVKLIHLIEEAKKYYNDLQQSKEWNVIEQLTMVDTIIKRLEGISTSSIGWFLNSDYVMDLYSIMRDNNYVVFSFKNIDTKKELLNLFWYYVFSNIKKYVDNSLQERKNAIEDSWLEPTKFKNIIDDKGALPVQVLIDEVWKYVQEDYIGNVLFEFAKAIRNKEWGICSITQEITDLLKNDYGRPLFTQVDTYLILQGLKNEEIDIVFKNLESKESNSIKMDDSDKAYILDTSKWPWYGILKYGRLPLQKIKVIGRDYINYLVSIGELDKSFLRKDELNVKKKEEKKENNETIDENKTIEDIMDDTEN